MCGIAGWINIPRSTLAPLEKMLDLIRHRGPDETTTYSNKNFAAGMVRLSINGLSNGSQPLWSFSGKIALFYNGEIYNSPKLRTELQRQGIRFQSDSDGEVLSHLFDIEGPKAFRKLDGMFAAALWNQESETLTLARDIPGEKPLYYGHHPSGGTVFAS
ncbi:MAG TPA: asparagine synthetase B, partial [Opitutae bacterium]|nr:asparagine synthetase B [Opitutae bacterium]